MTLAQDILDSNADREEGEAAVLIAGYAYGQADPAGVLTGGDAPLLEMLIDEDVLLEAPRLYRWDVPRSCRVLLDWGRDGTILTEAVAARILPRRAVKAGLGHRALEAMTRADLAEPVLEDASPASWMRPAKSFTDTKMMRRCDFCGHGHHCQPQAPPGNRWQKREYLLGQLRQIVQDAIRSEWRIPSSRAVARALGRADDRSVRSGWDLLTRRGELPGRLAASDVGELVADGWLEVPQVLAGFRLTRAGRELAAELGPAREVSPFAAYAAGDALN